MRWRRALTVLASAACCALATGAMTAVTVRVRAAVSGTPAGKVTVKARSATLCVITLRGATGSCKLTARKLPPGHYRLTASYRGGTGFAGSTSPAKALTVAR